MHTRSMEKKKYFKPKEKNTDERDKEYPTL
jgi:hypothetical protein